MKDYKRGKQTKTHFAAPRKKKTSRQGMEECEYFDAKEADPVLLQVLYEYTLALCNDIWILPYHGSHDEECKSLFECTCEYRTFKTWASTRPPGAPHLSKQAAPVSRLLLIISTQ